MTIKPTSLLVLEHAFFQTMESFLKDAIFHFEHKGVRREHILIFIPEYLVKMWVEYLKETKPWINQKPFELFDKYYGIKMLNNYENTVVVSYKELVYNGEEPLKMKVL